MKAVIQRVAHARVEVDGQLISAIEQGLLVLVCAMQGDSEREADKLLAKILKLRIFPDDEGRMNRSVQDVQGGLLIVSQFTLAADTSSGNRPGFSSAASPTEGRRLYEYLLQRAREQHAPVTSGEFGADMKVTLLNDGPVTIPMEIAPAP